MIQHLFHSLLPSIEHFHSLAYWVAFAAGFAETTLVVGLLLPGSTLLLILGALSATGQIDFAGVFWFGVAGAILGDNLNYWLGKRYGQRWLKAGVWFLKPEHFEQAHQFFDRHGAKSVFLGRFIPSIKEIAPFVAGSVGMRKRTFLFWNLLGGIGWGLQWIGGGYLFGQSLALAQVWISRIGLLFLAILLLWLLLWYMKHILVRQGPQIWLLLKSLYRSVAAALAANPYLTQFRRRHPRMMEFISQRFDRSHFSGLPLTLLSMSLLYIAILFGGVVEDLLTSDAIVALDHAVAQLVAHFRPSELVPVFTWVTALGMAKVTIPFVVFAIFGTWFAKGRWLAISLLVSVAGTAIFTALSKMAFHRPRPVEAVLLEQSYSFPSGHAAIAVSFYGFLGYILVRAAPDLRSRINRLLLVSLVILAIGLSRIVLGVHYLSDVWAGYLLGAGWLVIAIAISEWATSNRRIDWQSRVDPTRRRVIWLSGLMVFAWYVVFAAQWQPKIYSPPPVAAESVDKPLVDFIRQKKLEHTETLMGAPSQPLSVAFIVADENALVRRLEAAGWQMADRPTPNNFRKLLLQGMSYVNPPLAPVFWHGRMNDLGFERAATVDGKSIIDTVRLWKTPWRVDGTPVYVGVTRSFAGMYWGLLHRIAPDTDAATRRLAQSFSTKKYQPAKCNAKLARAEVGGYLLGMPFFSSGRMIILDLAGHLPPGICDEQGSRQ